MQKLKTEFKMEITFYGIQICQLPLKSYRYLQVLRIGEVEYVFVVVELGNHTVTTLSIFS